ncbi:MAG: hypothetical protein B9J98_07325 [Candidatus Terraquivivens tikiterensis]|uniref:Uncharacterized protein n=1 Tax=Candidatus Terraquivivens tikiterensis TaxID=1980982 RepID=A0A2R7Y314_9ARCH|nr:MAG: hypothetical protein B9J98_07325 [Candidatus Terraquivivens tikiterensis]
MSSTCPKCGGGMAVFKKTLHASVGPFSVKRLLPQEFQKYESVEFRICDACGYMEIYWKK